jgi:uncharacterized protein (DUF2267 family)
VTFKELVQTVARDTQLSVEESADLTRAVVQELGHRISRGEATQLAVELPYELATELMAGKHGQTFGLETLLERVRIHTGLNAEETRRGVASVLSALRETVSQKEFSDVLSQLPSDMAALARAST